MNKWFDLNSPVMRYLAKAADMIILSALWFICSIPVITIGPATAALYNVALKMVRKEETRITACFFRAFKENFKQGVVLNLIFIVLGAVLLADCWFWLHVKGTAGTICSGIFIAMFVWMLCIMLYTYPLQAQFVNTIRYTLQNAAILSMRKILDTLIIFVLHMLPLILAFVSLEAFVMTAPLWVLLAPAVFAYISSLRMVKIFDPLMQPEQPKENTENEEEMVS